jgi:Holliday junction DNA helicase RuvB
MEGFIKRTPRGREVTELAYKHLHRQMPVGKARFDINPTLFD